MNTDERPEKTMAITILLRCAVGKFRSMFSEDQFSRKREATRRIGIESRLL